jgi:hypothetical protein
MDQEVDPDCIRLAIMTREFIDKYDLSEFYNLPQEYNIQNIPSELRPLFPCALLWNIGDDYYQGEVLDKASPELLRLLVQTVSKYEKTFDTWHHEVYIAQWTEGIPMPAENSPFLCLMECAQDAAFTLGSINGEEHE